MRPSCGSPSVSWPPGAAWPRACMCSEFGHVYSLCKCGASLARCLSVKPWLLRSQAWVGLALFTMLVPRLASGDGGVVQLHEAQGPFVITVFVSPERALGGPTDVSVLVQWREGGEVILDADVSLAVDPPNGVT